MISMGNTQRPTLRVLAVFGLFLFLVVSACSWSIAEEIGTSKAIFYVA